MPSLGLRMRTRTGLDDIDLGTPQSSTLKENPAPREVWVLRLLRIDGNMRVRLTRKLANEIDGIDLSLHHVGDIIDLPTQQARTLMAEAWAERERRGNEMRGTLVLAFRRATDPGPLRADQDDHLSRAS